MPPVQTAARLLKRTRDARWILSFARRNIPIDAVLAEARSVAHVLSRVPYAGTPTYAQAPHETSPLLTPLSRAAGFESKRVDGFECRTSGEAVFELFWSDGTLAAAS